jgi:hypothetical protein
MSTAPILLFAYNRPKHLKRCIQSLQQNTLASESDLYVISDDAKNGSFEAGVKEVRQYLATLNNQKQEVNGNLTAGFRNVTIIERGANWGLADNIIEAVTRFTKDFSKVIVVEDDLVLAPHFLQFMNDALEVYKDEPRVGHIQACDFINNKDMPMTFLIKWTGSWGWGTWDRAWQYFNPDGQALLQQLEERKLTKQFDFNGKYGFTRMLRRQIAGLNNSWAIRWNASLFLNDMLSLNVGRSLVQNEGFDNSGTNCGGGNLYNSTLWMLPIPVVKENVIEENIFARRQFELYYGHTNSFWAKAWRRIKRTIKGDFKA